MSRLRRYHTPGNWYFITCVTYKRAPLLVTNIDLLKRAIARTKDRLPFILHSWVAMPDHFHAIIDSGSSDISAIMKSIKLSFGASLRSQSGHASGRVWQHRFWDHILRDDDDLNHHTDYIHFNPVKHGFVTSPFDWPHSSIHRFLERGNYTLDWGKRGDVVFAGDFGE